MPDHSWARCSVTSQKLVSPPPALCLNNSYLSFRTQIRHHGLWKAGLNILLFVSANPWVPCRFCQEGGEWGWVIVPWSPLLPPSQGHLELAMAIDRYHWSAWDSPLHITLPHPGSSNPPFLCLFQWPKSGNSLAVTKSVWLKAGPLGP